MTDLKDTFEKQVAYVAARTSRKFETVKDVFAQNAKGLEELYGDARKKHLHFKSALTLHFTGIATMIGSLPMSLDKSIPLALTLGVFAAGGLQLLGGSRLLKNSMQPTPKMKEFLDATKPKSCCQCNCSCHTPSP